MIGQAAKMFAAAAAFRSTGSTAAGRLLVRGLVSDDETVRNVAGILLVGAGGRSGPLLRDAVLRAPSRDVPMLLRVLADVGDPQWDGFLASYVDNQDPEIAQAARDAVQAARLAREGRRG